VTYFRDGLANIVPSEVLQIKKKQLKTKIHHERLRTAEYMEVNNNWPRS